MAEGRVLADDPAAYFDLASQAFLGAAARAGVVERALVVAGHTVRLRFAGAVWLPVVMPALAHLAVEAAPGAGLTVRLWDSASTASPALPAPTRDGRLALHRRGEVDGFNDQRFATLYHPHSRVLGVVDHARDEALVWTPDASVLPGYVHGAPLHAVLHAWLARRGLQLIHAAAVGREDGGVLLVGESGSGKSTTALACLAAGLGYAGDDYCLLEPAAPPRVHALYCSAKLAPEQLERFPWLAALEATRSGDETDKAVAFLAPRHAERLVPGFPLRAILLPMITGRRDTRTRPAARSEVALGWAPSTIRQLPSAGADAARAMLAVVGRVPGLVLEVGTDLGQIPAAIERVLAGCAARGRGAA